MTLSDPAAVLAKWEDAAKKWEAKRLAKYWTAWDACGLELWRALSQQTARVEALELFRAVLGWIVEMQPATVFGYVMGHHALDPIHDLPAFLREFPAVDLQGWMAKHGGDMDRMAVLQDAKEKP